MISDFERELRLALRRSRRDTGRVTLEERAHRSLRNRPQTADALAGHLGVSVFLMRATLAHMVWPHGKARPYGPVTCNRRGEYLLGDPGPLMMVPE